MSPKRCRTGDLIDVRYHNVVIRLASREASADGPTLVIFDLPRIRCVHSMEAVDNDMYDAI